MKKGLILILLVVLIAGAAFGQSYAKNYFSGELSVLGLGLRYERMITDRLSVGGNVYYNSLFIWEDIGADATVRFYPFYDGFLEGAFIGAGVGFHIHSDGFGILPLPFFFIPLFQTTGVAITPEIGLKKDIGKLGGFYMTSGIKVPITIGARTGWLDGLLTADEATIGIGIGVVPYVGLSYRF